MGQSVSVCRVFYYIVTKVALDINVAFCPLKFLRISLRMLRFY
jgi:hypothetical protein